MRTRFHSTLILVTVLVQLLLQPVAAASPCFLGALLKGMECCCAPVEAEEVPAAESCCTEEVAADEVPAACGCKLAPDRLPEPNPATVDSSEVPSIDGKPVVLPAFLALASTRTARKQASSHGDGEGWIPPRILWCVYRL